MKLLLIVAVCIELVYSRLPEGLFHKCDKSDRYIETCLLKSVESMRDVLVEGIPDIDFPSLEPFTMKKMNIDASLPGLSISGLAKNIVATGASEFKITKFSLDFDRNTAEVSLTIPLLEVEADYETEKSRMIFFFNVDSVGKFRGKFKDVRVDLKARGEVEHSDDDDLDYLRLATLTTKITIGRGSSIKVVPNAGFAAKATAALLNIAPTKLLLTVLGPQISRAATPIIKRYINNVLDELPLQDILRD